MNIKYQENQLDELDQCGRRLNLVNLEFHGIPKLPIENANEIKKWLKS